jgi:putative addiction module component (TIGR02574 family)
MTIEQVVQETRLWPDESVAELVDRIMLAKHGVDVPGLSPAWQKALAERVADIRNGKVEGVPGDDVARRIREIIGQ